MEDSGGGDEHNNRQRWRVATPCYTSPLPTPAIIARKRQPSEKVIFPFWEGKKNRKKSWAVSDLDWSLEVEIVLWRNR